MEEFHHLLKQNTDQSSQQVLKSKAVRKLKHLTNALENLQKKREEVASLHEVEVLISLVEKSHQEFEDFIDSNVDLIESSTFKFCRGIMMCNCSI